jgi:hypothetical protein
MKARKVAGDNSDKEELLDPDHENSKRRNAPAECHKSRFSVNWGLIAANRLFEKSQKAGETVAGFLDLAAHAFPKNWWRMEDELAVQHANVAAEIVDANLRVSVKDKLADPQNGKVPPTVSFDMGWQKRGQAHNSLSGHAFLADVHVAGALETLSEMLESD